MRPPLATPKVDLAREVLRELDPVDPSDAAPVPRTPETYGAPSESRLGVAAFPMQVAPRPVEVPLSVAPLVPVGAQLSVRPSRGRRVVSVALALLFVLAALAAAVALAGVLR